MMAPARPKKNPLRSWWDDRVKTPVGTFTYRTFIVLCLCSYTPLGESMMEKAGVRTASANIEEIATKVEVTAKRVESIETKVDALVVETERLKMEAERLAQQSRR